jgi:hypothetical protein
MCAFLGSGRTDEVTEFRICPPFVVSQPVLSEVEGNHERSFHTVWRSEASRIFQGVTNTRFFAGVYPESIEGAQTDIHKMALVLIPVIAHRCQDLLESNPETLLETFRKITVL